MLDAVIDLTLERNRDLLRRGAVLVDERDPGLRPRVLFYLEHTIQDAGLTRSGERRAISGAFHDATRHDAFLCTETMPFRLLLIHVTDIHSHLLTLQEDAKLISLTAKVLFDLGVIADQGRHNNAYWFHECLQSTN